MIEELRSALKEWKDAASREQEAARTKPDVWLEVYKGGQVNAFIGVDFWLSQQPLPWIDVRDRKPEIGQEVLMWWRHEEPEFADEPHFYAGKWRHWPSAPKLFFWQPLPDPPTPEQIVAAMEKRGQQ